MILIEQADIAVATDRWADARTLLDEARAICTPIAAQLALGRIAAIAAQLDEPANDDRTGLPTATRSRTSSYPAGLSPREVDVLRLVAEGLTNSVIAERLFLSPKTVSSHLVSIFGKIGVTSRAAATRFAIEHGLD